MYVREEEVNHIRYKSLLRHLLSFATFYFNDKVFKTEEGKAIKHFTCERKPIQLKVVLNLVVVYLCNVLDYTDYCALSKVNFVATKIWEQG